VKGVFGHLVKNRIQAVWDKTDQTPIASTG